MTPQNPQLLQQAFRGHGFNSARDWPGLGGLVPFFNGPHSASSCGGGSGGVPSLKHMLYSLISLPHPVHAQVLPLFHFSISLTVMPFLAASLPQVSPSLIICVAQVPSDCFFG